MIDTLPNNKKIHCNNCGSPTNHLLMCTHNATAVDEQGYKQELWIGFLVCAGCDSPSIELRMASDNPEDEIHGQQISEFIPERHDGWISAQYFRKLSLRLQKLYWEVVQAYNHNLNTLAAAGLRTLVEGICADKGVTGHNLENKINNLKTLLPEHIVNTLHSFRFIGNAAMHEQNAPEREDLRLAIGIIDDLLNYLYELDYKTALFANKHSKYSDRRGPGQTKPLQ